MCDCYTAKCENCGCLIGIHIADSCTSRENVHPYCNRCTRKIKRGTIPIPDHVKLFLDVIRNNGKYGAVEGGKKGEDVYIYCDDIRAYGIYLNQ